MLDVIHVGYGPKSCRNDIGDCHDLELARVVSNVMRVLWDIEEYSSVCGCAGKL